MGPSDDGICGSMDPSALDERKTPVRRVLVFVGRAERPGVSVRHHAMSERMHIIDIPCALECACVHM